MLVIKTSQLLRQHVYKAKKEKKRIALVPTMGNLHEGHMKLIEEAKAHSDIVIVSIFINPMQFDSISDLKRYPSTLQVDYEKLNKSQIDFAFTPAQIDIYPYGVKDSAFVDILSVSKILEGTSRPGHFRGVSTVVSKLFNLIQPNVAFFGEKDYQQLILIRRMVIDMSYDIEIISVPIVRAKDGLALSSRNNHLTNEERKIAPNLSVIMNVVAEKLLINRYDIKNIIAIAKKELNEKGFQFSKIYVRDADTLSRLSSKSNHAVILMSSLLGQVRLIDNKVIKLNKNTYKN